MRVPIVAGLIIGWAVSSFASAQSVATPRAVTRPGAAQPAAAREAGAGAAARAVSKAHPARPGGRRRAGRGAHRGPAGAPAGRSEGVLALGATDITGNRELPKVMAIVPWKDSPGPGTVIQPTDSLLDEVLAPVDRGAFQRRIRYYGQLSAAGGARQGVAPVGDRH